MDTRRRKADSFNFSSEKKDTFTSSLLIAQGLLTLFLFIFLIWLSDSLMFRFVIGTGVLALFAMGVVAVRRSAAAVKQLADLTEEQQAERKRWLQVQQVNRNYHELLQELLPLWRRQANLAQQQLAGRSAGESASASVDVLFRSVARSPVKIPSVII